MDSLPHVLEALHRQTRPADRVIVTLDPHKESRRTAELEQIAHAAGAEVWHSAGNRQARAAPVLRAVTAWVLGYVSVELRAMVDNPDEPDPAFRLGLYRMPFQELPRLRATAPGLAERGGPQGLAAGLDALLDHFAGLRGDDPADR